MISEPMVHSTQTVRLSYATISTISKWTMLSPGPRHLGLLSVASKMISEPMACLAQTIHQSCTNTDTISKQKEVRFHMTHVT
jgi:hypothetical protein